MLLWSDSGTNSTNIFKGGKAIVDLWNKTIHGFTDFSYAIGYFSEMIISIIVVSILYNDMYNHFFYFLGFFVSIYLNIWLKNIIKNPRPKPFYKFLAYEPTQVNMQAYGMPSGHSQHVFYSIIYLYLTIHTLFPWVFVCICIGALTIMERWVFRNHTMFQLIVGALIGCLLGYLTVIVRDNIG